MSKTATPLRLAVVCVLMSVAVVAAQDSTDGFVTGAAKAAWDKWQAAMQAVLSRDAAKSELAFGDLIAGEPSPMRVALLAERTSKTSLGGALIIFGQDAQNNALGENATKVFEAFKIGREQLAQADDGWYFCSVGRFGIAQANFDALLNSDPDPVALLEFADRVEKRTETLVTLSNHPIVGESAQQMLKLLARGEIQIKADPTRIKENLDRLAGPPRMYEHSRDRLKDSGEYAIPFLVEYLRNPAKRELFPAILRALPTIDRPALNPMVQSLKMDDPSTRGYLISAMGEIGYWQSVPYLLDVSQDAKSSPEIKQTADRALEAIARKGISFDRNMRAADAYMALAEDYYNGKTSLAADSRLDTANVWYWRADLLQNIEVPTLIFDEVMAMRCCEEALRLNPQHRGAQALWVAANFRRAAQLDEGQVDATRPANNPTPLYFALTQGAQTCLSALERAVDRNEPAVALGCIEALNKTAGPASLTSDANGRLPLGEALLMPDRMVRIQAALALGRAKPTRAFRGSENLMPVLSEALMLHAGAKNALVVAGSDAEANQLAGNLRALGYETLVDTSAFGGLKKVRETLSSLDVIVLASNIREPSLTTAIGELRKEFRFAAVPVVIVQMEGDRAMVKEVAQGDVRLGVVGFSATPEEVDRVVVRVGKLVGITPITPDVGTQLALESTNVLRDLAATNNPLLSIADAETALLVSLRSKDTTLRLAVADALGYLGSAKAQEAIAAIALDVTEEESLRVSMFNAVAVASKRRGSLLSNDVVKKITQVAEKDANMTIREAAALTLGALNVGGDPASGIIRSQSSN